MNRILRNKMNSNKRRLLNYYYQPRSENGILKNRLYDFKLVKLCRHNHQGHITFRYSCGENEHVTIDQLYLISSTGFDASSNTGHHKAWSHTLSPGAHPPERTINQP
jgi:hypothetical protein